MFKVGDKARWMGMQVTITDANYMNTTKGVIGRYTFVSPTGNRISDVPENELEQLDQFFLTITLYCVTLLPKGEL